MHNSEYQSNASFLTKVIYDCRSGVYGQRSVIVAMDGRLDGKFPVFERSSSDPRTILRTISIENETIEHGRWYGFFYYGTRTSVLDNIHFISIHVKYFFFSKYRLYFSEAKWVHDLTVCENIKYLLGSTVKCQHKQ